MFLIIADTGRGFLLQRGLNPHFLIPKGEQSSGSTVLGGRKSVSRINVPKILMTSIWRERYWKVGLHGFGGLRIVLWSWKLPV
jgi:hypothetical protein